MTTFNNNLINVEVSHLINEQDCQYGMCYHIHHIGKGIVAEVNALMEAESLGLIPEQEERDRSNTDVWSQIHLAFHEDVVEVGPMPISGLGATTFKPSQHVTINLPLSTGLAENIAELAKDELRARLTTGSFHKASDIEAIMWKLGISTAEGPDHLIYGDGDGRWKTFAGRLLVRQSASYDYTDYGVERTARIIHAPSETLIEYGDAAYGYVGIAPASRKLPTRVAEYIYIYVSRHYDAWAKEILEAQKASQRAWGKERNNELKAFGLSKAEIRGWWSLSWKKEWSAERWVEFCQAYSNFQLAAGLAADKSGSRTDYFKAIGIRLEGTIPRTQDAVEALAKAKGLKPHYVRGWRKEGILVDAIEASTDASGARTWSF